jgi:hypothetical protein
MKEYGRSQYEPQTSERAIIVDEDVETHENHSAIDQTEVDL